MAWKRICKVWETQPTNEWMVSHSANPVAEYMDDDRFRVYFNCRNQQNISRIAFVEIDITQPDKILALSEQPVVSPGMPGTFDESGASMGCLVKVGQKRYLYYLGWTLGVTVPWYNYIGLAISEGVGQPFEKHSEAPILARTPVDPYSLSYPWVRYDEPAGRWQMWYGSNLRWGKEQRDMDHILKYAESEDGIHWQPTGNIAIGIESDIEYAFSKPCVIVENGCYKMWYSFRGESYRIGYAESEDGVNWQRKDAEAGFGVNPESNWDAEMACYPNVFDHKGKRYMLYNGNGYGRAGIGLAVWE